MEKRAMIEKFFEASRNLKFPENIGGEYSPLSLAFVGDSVFELYVRTFILSKGNMTPKKLHVFASNFVRASSQAKIMHEIEKHLNEEELNIAKRGRNAKSGTVPKNANVVDYRNATGLECLYGYLYLKGEIDRLNELLELSINIINTKKDDK